MNLGELPMIIFTVFAQMSVGAFITLGVIQTVGSLRHKSATIDRIADPALYAIGPTLVLGLIASMFHMNDVFNVLNVFRGWESSWLSREIIFGMLFAGFGFLFAVMQWFKWGTPLLRRIVAGITALVGIGLVYVMSMIYYSLPTVPAWATWYTPVSFALTTILLGSLAVGMAFVTTTMFRRHLLERDGKFFGAKVAPEKADHVQVNELMASSLRWIAVAVIASGGALLVLIPMYLTELAGAGDVGVLSMVPYTGTTMFLRLALIAAGAGLLAIFIYAFAKARTNPRPLAIVVTLAFVLVLVGEMLGRAQFYESMIRIGM
ncbi:MAG: dimethyl sulfoxide reductase anchor subunit [Propionibacterium sp.]|nr:dimethyl sulfoxide reductase anchor subunit [Propionibacterium sp.]